MASVLQNLSSGTVEKSEQFKNSRVGVVVAEWNTDITQSLLEGAIETLTKAGVQNQHIIVKNVPGTFELTLGALRMLENKAYNLDGVICLGCVIQGDTPHFDYICQAVSYGITEVNLKTSKPAIFGVITTLNLQQALDRSGGIHGNKGDEAAITLLKMLQF